MSNPLKSVGKVFKKIVKTVKKVALPALAIAGVILTGGAALGALPALGLGAGGVAGALSSMGITGALGGILTTAAQGATMGFGTSLLTGGNPLKGATSGFIAGGVLGGAGAALGGAGSTAGGIADNVSSTFGELGSPAATAGLPSAAAAVQPAATAASGGIGGLGSAAAKVGGWAERNPIVAGNLINGLGGGMVAREKAKDEERQRRRIEQSYEGTDGLYSSGPVMGMGQGQAPSAAPIERFAGKYVFDGKTIQKVPA